jgi:cell division protein FtsQ
MNRIAKNIIIRLTVLLFVAAFVAFAFISKSKVNDFKVNEVKILIDELDDNFMLTKDDVYYLVTKYFTMNTQNIDNKTLYSIEQTVNKISCVERTQAYVDKDKNLCIEVRQRTPIARVYNVHHQNFYIDKYGIKFEPKQPQAIKVPIITGAISETIDDKDTIQTKTLKNILKFCEFLENEGIWKNIIGQININKNKDIELVPRIGKSLILLGDSENLEEKFDKLNVFYTEVLDKAGWEKYRVINIMYKDQIICLK